MSNLSIPDVALPLKSKRRITGLLIVLLASTITLAAVGVNVALRRDVDQSRRVHVSLMQLEVLAYHLSALEWQAIGEHEISSKMAEDIHNIGDEMSRLVGGLDQLDPNAENLRSVLQTYAAYNSAIDEEFRLIAGGDLGQAELVDTNLVDPAFNALAQALTSTDTAYQTTANQVEQVSNVGSVIVPLFSTVALLVLFSLVQQAHAETEAAGIEQRALAQSQEAFQLLNEMGNWLQACHTTAEAYGVIANAGQRLFPNESGALYIYNSSRNIVEAATIWGKFPTQSPEPVLLPDECWALRRGQIYMVEDTTSHEVLCKHLGQPNPDSYLCAPMTAQGETLGFLHLRHTKSLLTSEAQSSDSPLESRRQLAVTVSEHVALALTNIELQASLRNQAIRDPLTGLFNRRYMEETLERELARAARRKAPVGLVILDIDHFKLFNDTFGHPAGDKVLIELSSLLQAQFRQEDIPCRYGGEEFVLVLPDVSLHDTCRRAEQLRGDAQHLSVLHKSQSLGAITLSLGVANFPEHGRTVESLLAAADSALYQAKAEGRNRVVVAPVSGECGGVV